MAFWEEVEDGGAQGVVGEVYQQEWCINNGKTNQAFMDESEDCASVEQSLVPIIDVGLFLKKSNSCTDHYCI